MELKEAKYLGGIGAVLNLVSYAVGGILAIAGYVLILLALNKISKIFNDDEVFKKYLYGVVLWIIAVLIVIFAVGISFVSLSFIPLDYGLTAMSSFLVGVILFYILSVIGGYFIKKSYEKVSYYTGVDSFRICGLLYFIGTLLLIVIVGIIVIIVAQILEIVAYFSLPDDLKSEN
ncbi:DUF996 domain-containing protein [Methanocaldococcus jannaschii]|nr:DUF996 domain-containing protein [Methanocaldococcus jannaschii]